MDKVKRLVEAGSSLNGAVREILRESTNRLSVSGFALEYGLPRSAIAEALLGQRSATPALVAALIAELGGNEMEWRALLRDAREAFERAAFAAAEPVAASA